MVGLLAWNRERYAQCIDSNNTLTTLLQRKKNPSSSSQATSPSKPLIHLSETLSAPRPSIPRPVLGQLPMRTIPPPDKNKAQPLPTRTTIPRTIPHQDNSPLGPLPRNKNHSSGPKPVRWGIVLLGSCRDTT